MSAAQAPPALEISGLNKVYEAGKVRALNDLSLEVQQGDFFALLGNNGAGKSTAIGIVAGLVRKTSGTVRVSGLDIDRQHPKARRLIGLVPQEFNFNHFEKVRDIVATCAGYYGLARRDALANTEKYLRLLQLWDKRNEVARHLSGGMKRRLMIARALAHEPELLLLDEPTAGVDVQQRHDTWDFLRRINAEGKTIVLTTHYLEEAEALCHNLAIISDGHIVEAGPMRKLLASTAIETLILETETPLSECPQLPEGFRGHLDEGRLHVKFSGRHSLNTLMNSLEKQQISIRSMSRERSRLEALFLERTAGEESEQRERRPEKAVPVGEAGEPPPVA